MSKAESLQQFYFRNFNTAPPLTPATIGHFNVFKVDDSCLHERKHYSRRDFYKISLLRGHYIFHYADKSLEVKGAALLFFNPHVPYTWEAVEELNSGYFTIFSQSFFSEKIRGGLGTLPMFAPGGQPAYLLNAQQEQRVVDIFEKMLEENGSDYAFKYDLLRNYVTEMTHFALKTQPLEQFYQHPDAKARITTVFMELLERQFPIESPAQRFQLRSARDFAAQLSVHVNHLNRAVKETTGKTTTDMIAERLVSEARSLLKHTDWNIAEIGYALGFEAPSHFNHFFKKQTSQAPSYFRHV